MIFYNVVLGSVVRSKELGSAVSIFHKYLLQ